VVILENPNYISMSALIIDGEAYRTMWIPDSDRRINGRYI